jgi:hypothetical protein
MPCNGDSTTTTYATLGVLPSANLPGGAATGTGPVVMQSNSSLLGKTDAARLTGHNGTALATSDFVLSAGWGTSPVLTVVRGTDMAAAITIQAKATVGANPTVTFTFKNGTWTTIPVVVCGRTELVAATGAPAAAVSNEFVPTTVSATQIVFTFNRTPVANNTYGLSFICMGT